MTIPVPEPEKDDEERDDSVPLLPESEIPEPKLPDSDVVLPDEELGIDHTKPRKQAR